MPSPRYIPAEETDSPLGTLLGSFLSKNNQNIAEREENDALGSIYKQFKDDGDNIRNKIEAITSDPRISPTTRVNTVKQLLDFEKHNTTLQKKAQADVEKAQKKANEAVIAQDIQEKMNLSPEQATAYAANPSLLEKVYPKEPKVNQADRPIDPDQLRRIEHVRSQPGFDDLDEVEQYRALTRQGVSERNAETESKLTSQRNDRNQRAVESSYKSQEKFINDTTNSYKSFETDTKPKLLQMQKLASDDELISPTANVFLESLGIPLGALEDPSSELYQKLSLDLLKGLPETYGNRILKVEVDNFLKTVPGLANSPSGRRMIASNILKLGEMKEVYYDEMRKQQREYLDSDRPLPRDFQQRIFDQVRPQVDRINNEFVKMSEIKQVPPDTIPFFGPSGEIEFVPKQHAQWASENGGRRIW